MRCFFQHLRTRLATASLVLATLLGPSLAGADPAPRPLPSARFNAPYKKDVIEGVRARWGAPILDDAGRVIGRVRAGDVNVQPKNNPIAINGKDAIYVWRHRGPKKGREPSGWIRREDLRPTRGEQRAIDRGAQQAAARDAAIDKMNLPPGRDLRFTGRTIPRSVKIPAGTPGSARKYRLRAFAPSSPRRLVLAHNVPNQPRGGAVANTLSRKDVFHQANVRPITQRLANGKGAVRWVYGSVDRVGPGGQVSARHGWAVESIKTPRRTIRLLGPAVGRRRG